MDLATLTCGYYQIVSICLCDGWLEVAQSVALFDDLYWSVRVLMRQMSDRLHEINNC